MSISFILLLCILLTIKINSECNEKYNVKQKNIKSLLRTDFDTYFSTGSESELVRYIKHSNDSSLNELALEVVGNTWKKFVEKTRSNTTLKRSKNVQRKRVKMGYFRLCMIVADVGVRNLDIRGLCNYSMGILNSLGLVKFVSGYIISSQTCRGIFEKYVDKIHFIKDTSKTYSSEFICKIMLQGRGQKAVCKKQWSVNVPPLEEQELGKKEARSYKEEKMKILHFTDIHYDNGYKAGALAECGEPQCCNIRSGLAKDKSKGAGYWSDYRFCDLPIYTIENTFHQIRERGGYDYVYFTGDIIDHRVDETSFEFNSASLNEIYELMKHYFKRGEFFPVVGNHETHPINLFAPNAIHESQYSTSWLYNLLADQWLHWLPASTEETIRKGGYYTVLVRPGFRIVALNSNIGYIMNLWLAYNCSAVNEQLDWLGQVLLESESLGEKVHILSHLKTGSSDTWHKWAHEYRRIVERFQDTIAVEFNGHTHLDEFNLQYSMINTSKPIHVAYNGGSLTPYFDMNPNYKIYVIEQQNLMVEDYETWIFNLTHANSLGIDVFPEWEVLHKFTKTWDIETMADLESMNNLIYTRIAKNKEDFRTYYRHAIRNGDPFLASLNLKCDRTCIRKVLCQLVKVDYTDDSNCEQLIKISFIHKKKFFELLRPG